jgi:hypothetical protein
MLVHHFWLIPTRRCMLPTHQFGVLKFWVYLWSFTSSFAPRKPNAEGQESCQGLSFRLQTAHGMASILMPMVVGICRHPQIVLPRRESTGQWAKKTLTLLLTVALCIHYVFFFWVPSSKCNLLCCKCLKSMHMRVPAWRQMRHPWGETSAIQEDPINQRSGPNFRLACQSMADIFVSPGILGFWTDQSHILRP